MNLPPAMITLARDTWFYPTLILLAVAVAALIGSYRSCLRISRAFAWAFILKGLGLLFLTLILLEPVWNTRRAKPGANLVAVLADNSRSMTMGTANDRPHRGDQQRQALDPAEGTWLQTLAENFQVRRYLFDTRLHPVRDFTEISWTGQASELHRSLHVLTERYRNRPLAGILLFTDGNPTDPQENAVSLAGMPPVYPVTLAQEPPSPDLALLNVTVNQTSFEDAPITIQADVEAVGYRGQSIQVDLNDGAGTRIERHLWQISTREATRRFRFQLRPERSGVLYYEVKVHEGASAAVPGPAETSSEATLLNNQRTVVVNRGQGPYRVLYVAGRPNWEYKYLRRALDHDNQVRLVSLIRVAKREPKYDWRGRSGEQSNPLFRGYDKKDADDLAESYDQPVLVRLGTRDKTELLEGFPKTAESLFRYHALILDDVDAAFFQRDQLELIRRFVAERGGGFMMLGGKESYARGQFEHTPLSSLLPVYLDRLPAIAPTHYNRLELTRDGWLQPWIRLREDELSEKQRLADMPAFRVMNRVASVKPGARVLATLQNNTGGSFPALVVQRFGHGRAAALTLGDLWRWGLQDASTREDQGKFWRQTLRWLVADVPARLSLQVQPQVDGGPQAVTFEIQARHPNFKPMEDASVTVTVSPPPGGQIHLHAEPVADEIGIFTASYVPRSSGAYTARAVFTDAQGNRLGDAVTGWAVNLEGEEFQSIATDDTLLKRIARETGGRVLSVQDLDRFAQNLPQRQVPVTVSQTQAVWDLPGMLPLLFLLVVLCLAGEWILRRWKGWP